MQFSNCVMSWNEESSPHEPYTTTNQNKPSISLGQENIVTRHPPYPNQIYLAAENSSHCNISMDGNNKDKTRSNFYIPRGMEDDLRTTLRKHFSHLRLKLQLQPIMIDNKN